MHAHMCVPCMCACVCACVRVCVCGKIPNLQVGDCYKMLSLASHSEIIKLCHPTPSMQKIMYFLVLNTVN